MNRRPGRIRGGTRFHQRLRPFRPLLLSTVAILLLGLAARLPLEGQTDTLYGSQRYQPTDAEIHSPAYQVMMDAARIWQQGHGTPESLAEASEKFETALHLWGNEGDLRMEVFTLNDLANLYDNFGHAEKALTYAEQVLPLLIALRDVKDQALQLNNMGAMYNSLGEKNKALDDFTKALKMANDLKDPAKESAAYNNIGAVYYSIGEDQEALERFQQSFDLATNDYGKAALLNNMGEVYSVLGEPEKALEYYNRALPLWQASKGREGEGKTYNNMGAAYLQLDQTEEALDRFDAAIKVHEAIGYGLGLAAEYDNIGRTYLRTGDLQAASGYFGKALDVERKFDDRPGAAWTINNLGYAQGLLGDYDKAQDYCSMSVNLQKAMGDRAGVAAALHCLARFEFQHGDLARAKAHIEEALKVIELVRTHVSSQELRTAYFATVHDYYELDVEILMRIDGRVPRMGFDRQALEASERGRARTLLETLTEAHADIRNGVDSRLLDDEQALQEKVDARSAKLTKLMSGQHTEDEAQAARNQVDEALAQYQEVETKIRNASPRYAALTQPEPPTVDDLQKRILDADTTLLEYALGDEQSYLWVVTTNSLKPYKLPPRSEIEAAAVALQSKLTQKSPVLSSDQMRAEASKLAELMLWPAADQLRQSRLAIVADGALAYIPFGVLPLSPVADGHEPKTLAMNHELVYLPSVSTLAALRKDIVNRAPAPKSIAILADPVFGSQDSRVTPDAMAPGKTGEAGLKEPADGRASGKALELEQLHFATSSRGTGVNRDGLRRLRSSRREADAIASLTAAGEQLEALDFDASKALATSTELGQYRTIHFATHGLLNSSQPALSAVVLSLVNKHGVPIDGYLFLHDIYNLALHADLVVLSACQTGLGKEARGEGLIGLTRGFMYAGAPRVVVSLWEVDDAATAELMRRFYGAMLHRKLRPVEALKNAQNSMSNDPLWSSPHYWAAFVLEGGWN
jgi:CHAT domain-containing protein/Tfp pilus assembly protein PilF